MKKLSLMLVLLLAFTLTGFAANKKMVSYKMPNPQLKAGQLPQSTGTEIFYDDGTAENAWAFYYAGGEFGTWFTSPTGYPFEIEGMKWMIWSGWPDYDREEIGLCIWDCNTYTKIYQQQVVSEVEMPEWNCQGFTPAVVVNNDFIGSIQQKTNYTDCEGICVDEDGPYAGRDGYYYSGAWYGICYSSGAGFGNWLIRISPCAPEFKCKIVIYTTKVPRGCDFAFCLQFANGFQTKMTVTGDLIFKKDGVERKRMPVSVQVQPGQTVHKVYNPKSPANAAIGAYTAEFVGTANGQQVSCGPENFEVIEAAGNFVSGPCPCDP